MAHKIAIALAAVTFLTPVAMAQARAAFHAARDLQIPLGQGCRRPYRQTGPGRQNRLSRRSTKIISVEYAARSDAGNQAEIHLHWTHYIHILAGQGTLTYGGTVSNPKETAPGQIRGNAIIGGTSIALHEGDFLQIPAGTPHLFNAAPGINCAMWFSTRGSDDDATNARPKDRPDYSTVTLLARLRG